MESYSIFISSAPKDEKKIPFLLESIHKNLKDFDDIHIVTRENEDSILPRAPFQRNKYRTRWIYQQFLKLFQNVTNHPLYLTIDADLIFNRPMDLFALRAEEIYQDGKFVGLRPLPPKRIWWCGREQFHQPYYEFNRKIFGLEREFEGTFLCDMNFFDKNIINGMLDRYGFTKESLIEKSLDIISKDCHPSEADIYGQYTYKYHPDLYDIRQAKTCAEGRWVESIDGQAWPDLKEKIESIKELDVDIACFHSWFLETA